MQAIDFEIMYFTSSFWDPWRDIQPFDFCSYKPERYPNRYFADVKPSPRR